jgi:hypothetical protein
MKFTEIDFSEENTRDHARAGFQRVVRAHPTGFLTTAWQLLGNPLPEGVRAEALPYDENRPLETVLRLEPPAALPGARPCLFVVDLLLEQDGEARGQWAVQLIRYGLVHQLRVEFLFVCATQQIADWAGARQRYVPWLDSGPSPHSKGMEVAPLVLGPDELQRLLTPGEG